VLNVVKLNLVLSIDQYTLIDSFFLGCIVQNIFLRLSETLQKPSFVRNARVVPFIQLRYVLERSAPGNLSRVACGVLKASAEQQGVQNQRHDGVLSGPRYQ
jgi:hypothetical protein